MCYEDVAATSALFLALFLLRIDGIQASRAVLVALAVDEGDHDEQQEQTHTEQYSDHLRRIHHQLAYLKMTTHFLVGVLFEAYY